MTYVITQAIADDDVRHANKINKRSLISHVAVGYSYFVFLMLAGLFSPLFGSEEGAGPLVAFFQPIMSAATGERKRISVFVRSMAGGGAQRVMLRLANGLYELGHDVEIVTLHGNGKFRNELNPMINVAVLGSKRLVQCAPQLATYLKRRDPQMLLATEPACNVIVIIAKLLSRTKTAVGIREGLFPSLAMRMDPYFATRFAYRICRFVYPFADKIIALSGYLADDLAKVSRLPRSRIDVITFNPVVSDDLLNKAQLPPSHPWLATKTDPVIVSVGRLEQQKRFDVLIRAFSLVKERMPARLVIFGEGGQHQALQALVSELGLEDSVSLAGFDPSPYGALATCDCFVLSSDFEGMPNALIEAVACGAPIVSTDCPSGPRDMLAGGEFGMLVTVGDHQAMADAIVATINGPKDPGRQRRRGQDFTVAASARQYEAVLFTVK